MIAAEIYPRRPAQLFTIDKHLTILPVVTRQQLIHSQAYAVLSRINDAMTTRLFYQGKKLHSLMNGDTTSSLLRTTGIAHAERKSTPMGTDTLLLATNEPGSVVQTRAGSGPAQPLSYSAYGAIPAGLTMAETLMFNGEWREPLTGFYPLGNGYRMFSPQLMRFCSADSLSPFDTGGINAYAYCAGDPVNYIDPQGHVRNKTFPTKIERSNNSLRRVAAPAISRQPRTPDAHQVSVAEPPKATADQFWLEPQGQALQDSLMQTQQNASSSRGSRAAGYNNQQSIDELNLFLELRKQSNISGDPLAMLLINAHAFNLSKHIKGSPATKLLNIRRFSPEYHKIQRTAKILETQGGAEKIRELFSNTVRAVSIRSVALLDQRAGRSS